MDVFVNGVVAVVIAGVVIADIVVVVGLSSAKPKNNAIAIKAMNTAPVAAQIHLFLTKWHRGLSSSVNEISNEWLMLESA